MNHRDIARIRIQNQFIATKNDTPILEIVKYMGALQSQDYYSMLWSLGVRTGLTKQEIVVELEKMKVVRTWPQRGTIHLIATDDASWQVGLSRERMLRSMKKRREQLGLDEKDIEKATIIFVNELKGKRLLSRPKAMDLLEKHGISPKSGKGYHILVNLALKGIIFIGPMEGKQQTIGLLGEWTTQNEKISRENCLETLTKRYFQSHAPATLDDFCWWSGLTKKEARLGLEMNQEILESKTIEGIEYLATTTQWEADSNTQKAYLLSGFDEFMLGYKDRSAALPQEYAQKIVPGNNGVFLPTIVIAGQVVGTWKRKINAKFVDITLFPFRKLTKKEVQLLEEPIVAYSKFEGLKTNTEIK